MSFDSEEAFKVPGIIFCLFLFLFGDIETRIIFLYFISTAVSVLLREGRAREGKRKGRKKGRERKNERKGERKRKGHKA